jgi:hypothetical protein
MSVTHRAVIALSTAALLSPPALAQESDIQALRREMQEMRRDYETRLKQMEDRLQAATRPAPAAPQPGAPLPAPAQTQAQGGPGGLVSTPPTDSMRPAYQPLVSGYRTPQQATSGAAFNPAIGAVLQGQFNYQSVNPDRYRIPGFATAEEAQPARRGFTIEESEINFQANADQWLFGNLTIALAPENEVEVEEAYIQTTALPWGFTARGGRFFSGIGYMNEQHAHAWDFVDPALPYRAMLGNQYRDDGLQIRWLAPTDLFVELGAEAFRGDSFPSGGAARHGIGTRAAFAHIGGDIGASHSWRAGASYLTADPRARATNDDADTFTGNNKNGILDFVYKWAPDGNPTQRNLKLQAEFFRGKLEGEFNGIPVDQIQHGWYAQAIYQFMPRWRIGTRFDQVSARGAGDDPMGALQFTELDDTGHTGSRVSAMIDYSTSEFGRIRFQYNHDQATTTTDHQFFLQYTVSLGAHGAHQF